jgi:hypothetical protein
MSDFGMEIQLNNQAKLRNPFLQAGAMLRNYCKSANQNLRIPTYLILFIPIVLVYAFCWLGLIPLIEQWLRQFIALTYENTYGRTDNDLGGFYWLPTFIVIIILGILWLPFILISVIPYALALFYRWAFERSFALGTVTLVPLLAIISILFFIGAPVLTKDDGVEVLSSTEFTDSTPDMQALYVEIAQKGQSRDERVAAFEKLDDSNQDVFAEIAQNGQSRDERVAAIKRLTNKKVLTDIAQNGQSRDERDIALKRLETLP